MHLFESILEFIFLHQTMMIEIVIGLILATVIMWLFTNLNQEADKSLDDTKIKDIEMALKRVLEGTNTHISTAAHAASLIKDDEDDQGHGSLTGQSGIATIGPALSTPGGGAPSAVELAELTKLKSEMELKAKEMTQLQGALAQAQTELTKVKEAPAGNADPSKSAANTEEIQKRIQELESRLAEYEIIEDDIANLSLYKEENVRLKTEMEKMRGKSTPESVMSSNTEVAPSSPSAGPNVASSGTGTNTSTVPSVAPSTAPENSATTPEAPKVDGNELLKEFNNTVAASAVEQTTTTENKDNGEKLIAEFESFVKGGG